MKVDVQVCDDSYYVNIANLSNLLHFQTYYVRANELVGGIWKETRFTKVRSILVSSKLFFNLPFNEIVFIKKPMFCI